MQYTVTTELDDKTIGFRQPIDDPFVNTSIVIGWRDLLRGLLRGRLTARVIVDGDREALRRFFGDWPPDPAGESAVDATAGECSP